MTIELNKRKTIFTILILLGVFVGVGLIWGYENYKDDVMTFFDTKSEQEENEDEVLNEELVDDGAPYIADSTWDIGYVYDEVKDWRFAVFQPKVVEYKTVNGVNYLVGEYTFEDGLTSPKQKVDIVLSREDEWSVDSDSLNESSFEKAVGKDVKMEKTYNPGDTKDYLVTETMSLEDFKREFPVGSRVALKIPIYYPAQKERTKSACEAVSNICDLAKVWDSLSAETDKFNNGDAVSENFTLVPLSFSGSIFRWGEE